MILNIYRYSDTVEAEHVASVSVEEYPSDQISFANEYGGDFLLVEEDFDCDDYEQKMRLLRQWP